MQGVLDALRRGETVKIRPKGRSMEPLVHSGQLCTIQPTGLADIQVDDIVLCRVHGKVYLHKVLASERGRVLIGNNRGHINGWTAMVFGRLIEKGD
jgi:hypothetical protein